MTENKVSVPVIRYEQGGIPMYVGAMRARDILRTYKVDEFREEHLDAYQRKQYPGRTSEIAKYLSKCPIPIVPPVLASLRSGSSFTPNKTSDGRVSESIGTLEIPNFEGALFMVDGGHRMGGFKAIQTQIREMKIGRTKITNEEALKLNTHLDFEVPIAFIDAKTAADRVNQVMSAERKEKILNELQKSKLDAEDIERIFFFVINKTQKSIRPSLKDTLLYLIAAAGIEGIPIVEKEMWRAESTPLVIDLNYEESPLNGLISISGARGLGRPIQLASFVSSLEHLMKKNPKFRDELTQEQQYSYLKEYWSTIKSMLPNAFREDLRGEYLILRSLGVYTLNRLANDAYNWCREDGIETPLQQHIELFLEPLKAFDWSRETSPIGSYGGMRGVRDAYAILLAILANGGNSKALKTLRTVMKNANSLDVENLLATARNMIE